MLWLNAPEPVTLGLRLIKQKRPTTKHAQALLKPIFASEKVSLLLADGEFYKWEFIEWLKEEKIKFIIRSHLRTAAKQIASQHEKELHQPGHGIVVPYIMKKRNTKQPYPIKLVLWVEGSALIAFVVSPNSSFSAAETRDLYRKRFIIETYYRMMHRFQAFSCSQHPVVRFILVSIAFWLCNLWCYFKAPLRILKPTSRRVLADKSFPASTFCKSILNSWQIFLCQPSLANFRRLLRSTVKEKDFWHFS